MAQIKLNFSRLTKTQKLAKASALIAAGAIAFPGTQPKLTALTTAQYNAAAISAQVAAARAALNALEQQEVTIYDVLDDAASDWADTAQALSGGSAAKLEEAGFDIRSTSHAPIVITEPDEVSVTAGDDAGEIDIVCEPVRGAKMYEVQATTDLTGATGWNTVATRSASRIAVRGLVSGTKYAIRLRALGSGEAGDGPWSVVLQKMAP